MDIKIFMESDHGENILTHHENMMPQIIANCKKKNIQCS